jgi:hypothetical protein
VIGEIVPEIGLRAHDEDGATLDLPASFDHFLD